MPDLVKNLDSKSIAELKESLLSGCLEELKAERDRFQAISDRAYQDAIDGEIKQEGKYDTRAIEAGYLAGAQKRRLEEIKIEIQKLEALDKPFLKSSKVEALSLCKFLLSDDSGEESLRYFFLVPASAGHKVKIDSPFEQGEKIEITSLSTKSPIGQKILGMEVSSNREVLIASHKKEFFLEDII